MLLPGFVPGPIHCVAKVSRLFFFNSTFSERTLFACRKGLDAGILIVLKPPGLLHCEMPADTKAL